MLEFLILYIIMGIIIIINHYQGATEMDKANVIPAIGEKQKFVVMDRNQTLHSDTLFLHGNQVVIHHQGEQYCLRRTSNDKLILTK